MTGHAQETVEDCTAVEDRQDRLACYDRVHGRTSEPASTLRQPDPDSAASNQSRRGAEEVGKAETTPNTDSQFGRSERQEPEKDLEELTAKVVATGKRITGRTWFRLEGGQLWEEMTARRTGIAVDDVVRIGRSGIGTYHIRRADGSSRSSQVRRLE